MILDHHGGSFLPSNGGHALAIETLAQRAQIEIQAANAEADRSFEKYCVHAVSMEAEGWIDDHTGYRMRPRIFYIDHIVKIGAPSAQAVNSVQKAVPPDACPKPNGI